MVLISLSRGLSALVDEQDYPALAQHKWFAVEKTNGFYAARQVRDDTKKRKQRLIYMHREIARNPAQVDHANGNTLDNRRQNLRECTSSQNGANRRRSNNNTSGFKGVHLDRQTGKWRATIYSMNKRISLGFFETAVSAYEAYAKAANSQWGEFARV